MNQFAWSTMKQRVIDLLHNNGLSRLSDYIEQSIKKSLLITVIPAMDNEIPIGKSKLGGTPDLAPDIGWPLWKDKPLSFIAQINLADLPEEDFVNILPATGILYFFYAADEQPWGYDPGDKGSSRVLYADARQLERRNYPQEVPAWARFTSCSVEFSLSVTIPFWESLYVQSLNLSPPEIHRYLEFSNKVSDSMNPAYVRHRLLGHPDGVQGDGQLLCQLASNGLNAGVSTTFRDPAVQVLKAGTANWDLLLQVDSDDNTAMCWGDGGRLYYWIPRDKLEQREFEATWTELECW